MVLKAEAWDVNMLDRMGVAVRLSLTFRLLAGLDRFHLDQARPGPTVAATDRARQDSIDSGHANLPVGGHGLPR